MADGYDHDHETDQVRAPLCNRHNSALGLSGDTPSALREVADWLENADMGFTYTEATRAKHRAHYDRHRDEILEWQRAYGKRQRMSL